MRDWENEQEQPPTPLEDMLEIVETFWAGDDQWQFYYDNVVDAFNACLRMNERAVEELERELRQRRIERRIADETVEALKGMFGDSYTPPLGQRQAD